MVTLNEVLRAIDELVGNCRSRFREQRAAEKLERLALAKAIESTAGIAHGRSYSRWGDRSSAAAWVRARRTESPG